MAYRKAGYSKKFKAEHEADILLHQAAKSFFDEVGLEKLPTIRSLQVEYASLLAQKKEMYPEYRKLRSEMKELLTVRTPLREIISTGQIEQ